MSASDHNTSSQRRTWFIYLVGNHQEMVILFSLLLLLLRRRLLLLEAERKAHDAKQVLLLQLVHQQELLLQQELLEKRRLEEEQEAAVRVMSSFPSSCLSASLTGALCFIGSWRRRCPAAAAAAPPLALLRGRAKRTKHNTQQLPEREPEPSFLQKSEPPIENFPRWRKAITHPNKIRKIERDCAFLCGAELGVSSPLALRFN